MNKISLANQNFNKDVSFSGKRTDKKLVDELTQGKQSLFIPKERQIIAAINRMSEDSTKDNIEFLFSVAENLKYGTKKGSVINDYLNTNSPIANKAKKQNINWEEVLQSAIRKSLDKTDMPEKTELEERYKKAFPEKQEVSSDKASRAYWLSVNPTAQKEAEAIRLADKILKSEEFKKVPTNLSDEETKKLQSTKETAKKDMGYFLASSEVSILEKVECLKLLSHFMSPHYKINPQLKDRKVQAFSEILSDILVQTPEQEMLKSKTVIQLDGICADVSQKKALASEHKVKYVTNVMAELDDKPTMEVFDVTNPSKKVIVEKAYIDFDNERKLGYERILTPATKVWMNAADSTGNGELQAGKYTGSDRDNYEMARDSHWVGDMPPELQPKQNLLRAVIKTNEVITDIEKDKIEKEAKSKESRTIEKELVDTKSTAYKSVETTLRQLLPQTEADKIKVLSKKLLDPRKVTNPELKIDSREDDSIKKQKLVAVIKAEVPGLTEEKLNSTFKGFGKNKVSFIDNIFNHYQAVEEVVGKDKSLTAAHSPASKANNYENLYKLAAFYRVKKEREFDIPEKLAKTSSDSKEAALKNLEEKGLVLPRKTLDALQTKFNEIEKFKRIDNKNAKREGRSLDDSKVYSFSNEQIAAFDKIKNHYNEIKTEIKADYKDLNRVNNNELEPELKKLYADSGKARGQYWVGEEGQSGLVSDQQTRIMTQMSGETHYVERNISTALDHVEAGLGGGASGTSVSHKESAGHAQYVNDVDYVPVKDPKTGEITNKRALFHDNTWGPSEKDGQDKVWGDKNKFTLWKDTAGNYRTDYGRGFGGPEGFIFRNNFTTGVLEDYFQSGTLIHKPEHADNPAMKKLDPSIGHEMSMFRDIILRGSAPKAVRHANELVKNLLEKQDAEKEVETLMKGLTGLKATDAAKLQANIKNLNDIEKRAQQVEKRLTGIITGSNKDECSQLKLEKGINTREDYNKIPDNHVLKLMLRKASMLEVSKNSFGTVQFEEIAKAKTQEQLDKAHQKLVLAQKVNFDLIFKDSDKIKSISELKKSPTGKAIVNWIDKKFNPKDDKEFMESFKKLAGMPRKERHALILNSTDKELGVVYEDPCAIALRIKGKNESAQETFKDAIVHNYFIEAGITDKTTWLYRSMVIDLSNIMKITNRQEGIDQHGVRPALPELSVYDQKGLKEDLSANLQNMCLGALTISELKQQKENLTTKFAERREIDKTINDIRLGLKQGAVTLVKANVIPREQNTALEMITKLFKVYAENPKSEESKKLFDDTTNLITEKHLTNHPKEMLEYVMKETPKLAQDTKNKKINTQIVCVWSQYLADSLRTASNAHLEFKLMEKISDGEMPSIAKMFKDPKFSPMRTIDDNKPIAFNSEQGINYLLETLADPANNNSTLKFFVQQTGLTNDAIKCLLKGPKPQKFTQDAKECINDIKKHSNDMKILINANTEFSSNFSGDIDVNNTKAMAKLYFNTIDKPFKEKGMEGNETLKRFKENMLIGMKKAEKEGKRGVPVFAEALQASINNEIQYEQELKQEFNGIVHYLNSKSLNLSSFDELLPERSELKAKSKDCKAATNKELKAIDKYAKQTLGVN